MNKAKQNLTRLQKNALGDESQRRRTWRQTGRLLIYFSIVNALVFALSSGFIQVAWQVGTALFSLIGFYAASQITAVRHPLQNAGERWRLPVEKRWLVGFGIWFIFVSLNLRYSVSLTDATLINWQAIEWRKLISLGIVISLEMMLNTWMRQELTWPHDGAVNPFGFKQQTLPVLRMLGLSWFVYLLAGCSLLTAYFVALLSVGGTMLIIRRTHQIRWQILFGIGIFVSLIL